MSVRTELANAARRVRAANERLPEKYRRNLAPEWVELIKAIEDLPDWKARRHIAEWVERMEDRLTATLLNAPLEVKR